MVMVLQHEMCLKYLIRDYLERLNEHQDAAADGPR